MHAQAGLCMIGLIADDCTEGSAGSKGFGVLQCCSCGGRAGQPARAATVAGAVSLLVMLAFLSFLFLFSFFLLMHSAFVHVGALQGMLEFLSAEPACAHMPSRPAMYIEAVRHWSDASGVPQTLSRKWCM